MGARLIAVLSRGAFGVRSATHDHRFDLAALAVFAVARVVSTAFIVQASAALPPGAGVGYWSTVARWDAGFYREIATMGYPPDVPPVVGGRAAWSSWAFLPLYPALVRLAMALGTLPFEVAATVVSLTCGGVAAVLFGRLMRDQVGDARGVVAFVVFCCAPAAAAEQLAYTESLGLALLAGVLLAVIRRRFGLGGVLALLLGLTRAIALPLIAVALVAAVVEWRRGRPLAGRTRASLAVLVFSCCLAGVLWPALVWAGTGRPDAYALVGSAWWPDGVIRPFSLWSVLAGATNDPYVPLMVATGAPLVPMAAALALSPWSRRLAPTLRAWCVAYPLFLSATVQVTPSLWRYLLALAPLSASLVGAAWVGRLPTARVLPWRWVVTLGLAWSVAGVAAQWLWVSLILVSAGMTP